MSGRLVSCEILRSTVEGRFLTAVWTDGLGSFQGRCLSCSWRGLWREGRGRNNEPRAIADAKAHGAAHAAERA